MTLSLGTVSHPHTSDAQKGGARASLPLGWRSVYSDCTDVASPGVRTKDAPNQ